jgi:hypothetical protein
MRSTHSRRRAGAAAAAPPPGQAGGPWAAVAVGRGAQAPVVASGDYLVTLTVGGKTYKQLLARRARERRRRHRRLRIRRRRHTSRNRSSIHAHGKGRSISSGPFPLPSLRVRCARRHADASAAMSERPRPSSQEMGSDSNYIVLSQPETERCNSSLTPISPNFLTRAHGSLPDRWRSALGRVCRQSD